MNIHLQTTAITVTTLGVIALIVQVTVLYPIALPVILLASGIYALTFVTLLESRERKAKPKDQE